MKKRLAIIISCVFFLLFSPAMKADAQLLSTEGKEFWLSFLKNIYSPTLTVFITAKNPCSVTLQSADGSFSQKMTLSPDSTARVDFDNPVYTDANEVVSLKGLYIQSTDTISVYASNKGNVVMDMTKVIPLTSLGSEYLILDHANRRGSPGLPISQFMIVGVEDNTEVELFPTSPSTAGTPNTAFVVTLNKGQTYLYASNTDLTGSRVKAKGCKKIAVFSGSPCTNIPDCFSCDNLFEQNFPTNTLGINFLVSRSVTRGRDYLKFVASQNNTKVYINNTLAAVLNAGNAYESYLDTPVYIRATKPILVAFMGVGGKCTTGEGDPFMIYVTPIEQAIESAIITTVFETEFRRQFVNIQVKTADKNQTFLDGQNIGGRFAVFPNNPEYSHAHIEMPKGVHTIKNAKKFTAYVYAFENSISFGYSAGSLLTKSDQFALVNGISSNLQKEFTLCPLQTITFEAVRQDTLYSRVFWHFDDGAIDSGNLVNKTFSTAGCHNVQMISYYTGSSGNCLLGNGATDTTFLKVCVLNKLPLNVGADTGFCKGKSRTLQSNIFPDGFSYVWNTGETTPSIDVNKTGVYWLELRNGNCSVTDSITVTIVDKPIVFLQGSKILCTGDSLLLKNTVNNPAVTYLWSNGKTGYSQWIKQPGVYTLYANNKGCSAEGSLKAEEIICPDIYIPTAFTPNGDGKNDVLRPIAAGVELLYFRIYNRYGQLVFETKESGKGWDGKLADIQQPMATYVFAAEARDNNGKSYFKKGSFVLIR